MTGNQIYNHITEVINDLHLPPDALVHVITLMAAQIPHAPTRAVKVFRDAEEHEKEKSGEGLLRLLNGQEPTIDDDDCRRHDMDNVISSSMPESDEDRPVITLKSCSNPDVFIMDGHNAHMMCVFHELLPPSEQDYEKSEIVDLVAAYGHVHGGFTIRFHRGNDDVVLILHGKFSVRDFIPVRIDIIEG